MNNQRLLTAANKTIRDNFPSTLSIAFVTSTLMGAELPFWILNSVNQYLQKSSQIEFSIYNMQRELPIVSPLCAIYSTLDLMSFDGVIITTDIPSWQTSLVTTAKSKYLYVYDIHKFEVPPELISKINESGVKIIARTKAYAQRLSEMGYKNILSSFIEEPNVDMFIEIIRK